MMKIYQYAKSYFSGQWVGVGRSFLRFNKDEFSKVSIGQNLCKNSRVNKAFSYNQINNENNHWELDTL